VRGPKSICGAGEAFLAVYACPMHRVCWVVIVLNPVLFHGIKASDFSASPGVGGSMSGGACCGSKDFIMKTRSAALNGFCMTRSY
jgi:hypothetical protein